MASTVNQTSCQSNPRKKNEVTNSDSNVIAMKQNVDAEKNENIMQKKS